MSDTTQPAASSKNPVAGMVGQGIALLNAIPAWAIALVARVGVFGVFWQSARLKVEGFKITDQTYFLFQYEYELPLLSYRLAAQLATVSEHLFSALILVGLLTRFSAVALLGMTLVIQIFVYPTAWPTHTIWAAALLYLVARGPGVLSIDHIVARTLLK